MTYGAPEWQSWVLEEEESLKHIKAACVLFLFHGASFEAEVRDVGADMMQGSMHSILPM